MLMETKSPGVYGSGAHGRRNLTAAIIYEPREGRGLEDRYVSLPVSSVADLTDGFSSSCFGGGNSLETCKNSGW